MKRFIYMLAAFALMGAVSCQPDEEVAVHASFTTDKESYDVGDPVVLTNTSTAENALIAIDSYDNTPRQQIGYNEALRKTFRDERIAFTEEQVKKETARCLGCGASIVDPNKCIGCGICTTKCAFDAIHLHRERPECSTMYKCEDKMKAILPYMIKRNFKIKRAARKSK